MSHPWKFFRSGGLDQIRLTSADDLRHLHELDQKLWVALSCPVKGLEFDERTLALIDTDGDGRVRVPEVITAVQWICRVLQRPEAILVGTDGLPLDLITSANDEGSKLLASCKRVLANLGKPEATVITVAEASDSGKIFAASDANGDGIVVPEDHPDPALRTVLGEIATCFGTVFDRNGKPGIDQARCDAFFTACEAYAAWWTTGDAALILGERTPAAHTAFLAVKAKIDDWFVRGRLAAFDPRALAAANRPEAEYLPLAARELTADAPELAGLPLRQIGPGQSLELGEGINPAWTKAMTTFRSEVVTPLLGPATSALSEHDWESLCARFAPYATWLATKQGATVEALGIIRVRELIAAPARSAITTGIARDLEMAAELAGLVAVERAARYHRDLGVLLRNFLNFTDFYDPDREAVFQAGKLYLDQRSFDLCLKVEAPDAHAAIATMGRVHLAYLACTRIGCDKLHIVAAVTQGDSDYLMPGRNGVFYDRRGRDWDATVVKIVENPISLGQAFWSPYKKLLRFIEEQVAKRAADAATAVDSKLVGAAAATAHVDTTAKNVPRKIDIGTVAAIGIAFGAIGTALATVYAALLGLGPWLPVGLLAIMAAISIPSVVIAGLKLHQRSLGPLLEGCGWAINGRVKINIPLGNSLTQGRKVPPSLLRNLSDPFEDKAAIRRRQRIAALLVLIALLTVAWFCLTPEQRQWRPSWWPKTAPAEPTSPAPAAAGEAKPQAKPEAK